MPHFETHGNGRVELPLRAREPVNRVDRESMRFFETEVEALRYALRQEHREFPDHHGTQPHDDCPLCDG